MHVRFVFDKICVYALFTLIYETAACNFQLKAKYIAKIYCKTAKYIVEK